MAGAHSEKFYLLRWVDSQSFDIVTEEQIKAQTGPILVYETYTVNFNGQKRKGTVILMGSKEECEKHRINVASHVSAKKDAKKKEIPRRAKSEQFDTDASTASDILSAVLGESSDDDEKKEKRSMDTNGVLMKILQLLLTGNEGHSDGAHKVRCAGCKTSPITTDRYKCLNCNDLNLCAKCFERRRESSEHKSGHAFAHFKSPGELFGQTVDDDDVTLAKLKETYGRDVHESISCDGCKSPSITGLRFKCDSCPNYDLCEKCMKKSTTTGDHKLSHSLLLVSRQVLPQIPYDDIELTDELGKGAFGAVYKAKWLSKKRVVACKVIEVPRSKEAERLEKSFMKEISAYAELSGAFILKIYGFAAARFEKGKKYMIIMEYMARGSLSKLLEDKGDDISLRRRLDMAINIASGMRKIHEHGMIHRDIRPDNILVNENYTAKIGDMGIARVADPLKQHTQIGCQSFMPPEFHQGEYDQKLDIFTFGLTLNQLFTSQAHIFQPFVRRDRIAFQEKSPVFDDLIARCTMDDPKRRPAAIEIEKTLDLYSQGFNEIVMKKHPSYMQLETKDKDEIFIAFYKKFYEPATEFIRKKFPPEFLDNPEDVPGVKVDKEAGEGIRVECPMQ